MLARADLVVVYGGGDTVEAVRACLPETTPLVAYSHRVGVALVGRAALTEARADRTAMAAARAIAAFDQRGCVSPHLLWVEEGGVRTAAEWAGRLAAAMAAVERDLPAGPVPSDTLTGAGGRSHVLAERLARAGVTRVTSLQRMAWPPAWWHQDGGDPLRALVRWVDWETD